MRFLSATFGGREYFNGMSPDDVEGFYTTAIANYGLVQKVDDVEIYRRVPAADMAKCFSQSYQMRYSPLS